MNRLALSSRGLGPFLATLVFFGVSLSYSPKTRSAVEFLAANNCLFSIGIYALVSYRSRPMGLVLGAFMFLAIAIEWMLVGQHSSYLCAAEGLMLTQGIATVESLRRKN